MGLLLSLKALGNKELIKLVHLVENYKERTDCTIYTQVDDGGIYVYDTKNVEFLLYIKVDISIVESKIADRIYDNVV